MPPRAEARADPKLEGNHPSPLIIAAPGAADAFEFLGRGLQDRSFRPQLSAGPAAAPQGGPWWTPPLRPPRGSAAMRRGMNQRKCSCSLSLSRSSLRVAGVPQTQPPSLNGALPRRAEDTRPWPLHLPGGGPPKWSGVAAVPTFMCLGPSFDQAPPTRPPREQPPPTGTGASSWPSRITGCNRAERLLEETEGSTA
jgi:hypothetical protein